MITATVLVVRAAGARDRSGLNLEFARHFSAIIEREQVLGGTPQIMIPSRRLPDIQPEIDAVLAPALSAGRLTLRLGEALGRDVPASKYSADMSLHPALGAEVADSEKPFLADWKD